MGKVSNRSSVVSTRRRLIKASSGVGVKKSRGTAKVSLPPPPPPQSLVLDEDSGFGGDQSLDSESSLLSAPGTSSTGLASLPSVLPSLAMVPQAAVENKFNINAKNVQVDLGGDETQELPASRGTNNTHPIPPLVSFRDISLLSSLRSFQGSSGACSASLLCVDGRAQPCGHSNKIQRPGIPHTSSPLNAQLSSISSDGTLELKLINQPEEQHRARYQTEGSRGAVKDRTGLGHPTVKLFGYSRHTTIQVFVGSDTGKTGPHMFYQVCRVSGKNSTPCKERRIDGTAVIETSLDPETDMTMSCDCVGILKERNVDVEHRFKAAVSRGRKKSTKCRLVFRTFVTNSNGAQETLQVVSQPIACTQPPGVPEISRKSLTKCSVVGGEEMFIFGKNFLKDTMVIFQQSGAKSQPIWEEKVLPDKETLQPIHLIVMVPKYYDQSIMEEVTVEMMVSSGGKTSESHCLTYVPLVTKRELSVTDTHEDKPLPKGVSPCALQLNRHFAETGTLPTPLPETTTTVALPTSAISTSVAQPVRVSRLMLNSTTSKKASSRAQRSTPRISKTLLLPGKSSASSTRSSMVESSVSDISNTDMEKRQEKQGKVQSIQGTVSLESLVEMLKVVQKFPAGSNIHTSVLQLVEELVKSMKENIKSACKIETIEEPLEEQEENHPTPSDRVVGSPPSSDETSISCLSNGKTQKMSPQLVSPQPQVPFTNGGPSSNVAVPVSTTVSLFPLTLFPAIPSTIYAGPRVARVAPVAPTTVVSSPGLTRTVRVCVAEAPNFLDEPPAKKQREHMIPMDYHLVRSNQFGQEPITSCSLPSTVVTQTPPSTSFNNITPLLPQKGVSNQCSTRDSAASPAMDTPTGRLDLSTSQEVLNAPSALTSQHITETPVRSTNQALYQPVSQSVLRDIGQATTQHERQSVDTNQTVIQGVQQTTCLPTTQTSQTISQPPPQTERQVISQHTNQQTMTVQSSLPVTVTDPLLSQSTGLCPLLSDRTIVTSTATTQETMLPSAPVTSSALTHSDPLLSQSSPVAPIHIDTSTAATLTGTEPANNRARGDPLLATNPAANQASMQNEVTSAINLSETELLNYFDPNCFDNV